MENNPTSPSSKSICCHKHHILETIYNTLRQTYCVSDQIWYMRELKKIIEEEEIVKEQ